MSAALPLTSPLVPGLAAQIVEIIRRENLEVGQRITEQSLCDALGVSRSPVRKALQLLEGTGVVRSEPNKGFQVAKPARSLATLKLEPATDSDEAIYLAIADDRLAGELATDIAESELMERYRVSRPQVQRVLHRLAHDGVIERNPGRGWTFQPLMNTPEAYREGYRFRMIIEPAAVLEPGYAIDPGELEKCYREQMTLLEGGIEKWPVTELFKPGVHLHETIVAGAHNRLLLDALRRVNQARRLVEYRQKRNAAGMRAQCEEHLVLIDLLRRGALEEAAAFLKRHLDGARERKSAMVKRR